MNERLWLAVDIVTHSSRIRTRKETSIPFDKHARAYKNKKLLQEDGKCIR